MRLKHCDGVEILCGLCVYTQKCSIFIVVAAAVVIVVAVEAGSSINAILEEFMS